MPVRVNVGGLGLCCCTCVTYFERKLTPLCIGFVNRHFSFLYESSHRQIRFEKKTQPVLTQICLIFFSPVSNLSFGSKRTEKIVPAQHFRHLDQPIIGKPSSQPIDQNTLVLRQLCFVFQWPDCFRFWLYLHSDSAWSKRCCLRRYDHIILLESWSGIEPRSFCLPAYRHPAGPSRVCLKWSALNTPLGAFFLRMYLLWSFMYLVFSRMPGESHRRQLRSSLLCSCDVFGA